MKINAKIKSTIQIKILKNTHISVGNQNREKQKSGIPKYRNHSSLLCIAKIGQKVVMEGVISWSWIDRLIFCRNLMAIFEEMSGRNSGKQIRQFLIIAVKIL
jgi:hypothetical protein